MLALHAAPPVPPLPRILASRSRGHAAIEITDHPGHLAHIRRWLHSSASIDRTSDLALVASELVGNALRHTRSGLTGGRARIDLSHLDDGSVLLAVTDQGALKDCRPNYPRPSTPGPDAEHGRGLAIVAAMADGWSWTPELDGGITVTALFRPSH